MALPVLAINSDLSLSIQAVSWAPLVAVVSICGKRGWYMAKPLYKKYGNWAIECFKKLKC